MPTIEHDMLPKGHKGLDLTAGLKTPVHTVYEADEEERFNQEMREMQHNQTQDIGNDDALFDEISNQLPFEELAPQEDKFLEGQLEKKKTFEKLLLFKKPYCKEVEVDGVVFKLKLLNSNESNQVYKEIMRLTTEEQLSKSSLMLLSASLIEADGVKLEEVYSGPAEITSPMIQRYYELSQWHAPIINILVKAYQGFVAETEKEFSNSFLDKSPKIPTTD